jgi:hypothetical protein
MAITECVRDQHAGGREGQSHDPAVRKVARVLQGLAQVTRPHLHNSEYHRNQVHSDELRRING